MKQITIIGGGFSGLTTAYFLARDGVPVTLIEKQNRLGGMVDTVRTPLGLVETAASGITASARLEALCKELGVPLLPAKKESKRRYLFRNGKPRQWPLTIGESFGFAGKLGKTLVTRSFKPRAGETIDSWGNRIIGPAATHVILAAALQGIYAGDSSKLSADLIFGRRRKPAKGEMNGLVAPPEGLAQITAALEARLRELGVEMRKETGIETIDDRPTIIATSARDASTLLLERAPETSKALASLDMVPLLRVTAFYPSNENTVNGFGVLFPRNEGVRALGVLFNTNIFANRGEGHSESWIYGGGTDRSVLDLDDASLFDVVNRDREMLMGRHVDPIQRYPQRWHVGLPHYDMQLDALTARGIELPKDVFLSGNYLRGIGLPMLLERSFEVAQEAKQSVR